MKKLLLLVLALMLAVGSIPFTTAMAEDDTLVFWDWWSASEESCLRDLLAKFTEETGIKVETLIVKDIAQIMTTIAGGNPPDLIMVSDRAQLMELVANGAVMPIDDYMAQDGISFDMFLDGVEPGYVFDGKTWGLPCLGFNGALFYNKDAFKEAGLDPEAPPTTAEELAEYAKKLTVVNEKGELVRLGINVSSGWFTYWNICSLFGTDYYDSENKKFNFEDENVVRCIEWMRSLYDGLDYQAIQDFKASFGNDWTEEGAFEKGAIAMKMDGCWCVAMGTASVPDLNYGTFTFPASEKVPEKAGYSVMEYNPHFIPVGCPHPDKAWQLLKYVCTDENVGAQFADYAANIDHLKKIPDGYVSTLMDNPNFQTFINQAGNGMAGFRPIYAHRSECQALIGQVIENLLADHSLDAASELKALNEQLNAMIAE